MRTERVGSAVGAVGSVISCSGMFFSWFPGLMGAATASTTGMGMMMGTPAQPPGWAQWATRYSPEILAVSVALMLFGILRAPLAARVVALGGIAMLIVNEVSMEPYFFFPGLALVIAGSVMAARQALLQNA